MNFIIKNSPIKNSANFFFTKKNKNIDKPISITRDYYTYAGFILIVALSSSLWSAIALYNSQKIAIQDQLIAQSDLIDTQLGDYLNYVSHIAEDKGHKIALKENNLADIAYLFKRNFFFPVTKSGLKRKAFIWPHFSWVDRHGNILVKSETGILAKPEKYKAAKHLYLSTINAWQFHLSEPYYDALEDKIFIDASLGVLDLRRDKYVGSITTRFNVEKLVETIKTVLRHDTKFIILNDELKIIIQSDRNLVNNDDYFVGKLANIDPEADITSIDGLNYQGNVYKIYKKSSDYPFIILTGYNASSYNKEFIINLIKRFVAIFGAAFSIAIILFFQRQRIIKPINYLAQITKKLVDGKNDFEMGNFNESSKHKYSQEIYELYQGILLTKALIDQEKNNKKLLEEKNSELTCLNNKLEQQNELIKKSAKSREKFLYETKQNIIEDSIKKIAKDITLLLERDEGKIMVPQQTLTEIHKRILSSCTKILSDVSDNLNLSYVNVKNIIEEAIEMAHYDASANDVELIADIASEIPDIYVDPRSIKHVIVALINYAIKDRRRDDKNSFIKIVVKLPEENNGQLLHIIFEDNGHGISEQMRLNFEQIPNQENKNQSNTSLSLQAIRSILSFHKATLEINNIVGQGSIMIIEVPFMTSKDFEDDKKEHQNKSNIVELFPRS